METAVGACNNVRYLLNVSEMSTNRESTLYATLPLVKALVNASEF